MLDRRTRRLRTALDLIGATGLHRVLAPLTRGAGVVFTLHHVRPWHRRAFAPNRLLEITPDFLETSIEYVRKAGYDIVTLDEALRRLKQPGARRFAAFTFDDGYRDVRDHALPILRRHGAPSTLFITTSFADGTGELWWVALEEAIRRSDTLDFDFGTGPERLDAVTTESKHAAWERLYWHLRGLEEGAMRAAVNRLATDAGFETRSLTRPLCMDWNELSEVATDPLVEIGNHTASHFMLAKHPEPVARAEIADTQARITQELGLTPRHIAYPVGDPGSAGIREFAIAQDLGLAGGWTTRLGVLFPEHAAHPTAMPRVSLNGHYQDRRYLELFLSGVPFALQNRFRSVNVG